MKLKTVLGAGIMATFMAGASAVAEEWPTRAITMIGPFGAGGSTDIVARIIAEEMSQGLGQPVVVEARPGSSGVVGVSYVARAEPDGYTILIASSGTHAANPNLLPDLPYDPVGDFEAITQLTVVEAVLAIHPSVPAETLEELIDYARENPGELNYGSAGMASAQHIGGALLEEMAGIEMVHVPYAGSAPAIADLIAGNIQMVFGPVVELMPQIESGALRGIAVTALERSELMPDLPTMDETLPGYELASWQGLFVPAGTPREIVDRIYQEVARAYEIPEVRSRLADQGLRPVGTSPEEFGAFIPSEIERWGELIRLSGAEMAN